jgi:hypothetical protein
MKRMEREHAVWSGELNRPVIWLAMINMLASIKLILKCEDLGQPLACIAGGTPGACDHKPGEVTCSV